MKIKLLAFSVLLILAFTAPAQTTTDLPKNSNPVSLASTPAEILADIPTVPPNTDTNGVPTITGGLTELFQAFKENTNLLWEVHGLYASGLPKKIGGGVGAVWPINQYSFASVRIDWVNGGFWMPQGNFGLQLPIKLFSWLTVTPFTYAGIAVPVSGAQIGSITVGGAAPRDNNGQATAILGGGGAINVYSPWHLKIVGDVERWTGFPGNQYRFGLTFR